MYSLKTTLNKSLVLNMILVMLLMLVILNIFIREMLREQILTRLQHDAESIVSVIQQSADNSWQVNPAHISTVYNRVHSGHYYVVKYSGQTIRSRSLFDYEFSIPELGGKQSSSYQIKGIGEESWLVWQQLINKNNVQLLIWVAEDIAPVQQQLVKFSIIAVLLVIFISVLLIFIQQKILNRAFTVFDSLRNNLHAVRHGETDPAGTQVPVEISPLVSEIEMLVEQLRLRIQRTRNAIGNLAHEVKRPLQILSLYIESGESRESARQSFDDIKTIVDRELRRAKVSGSYVVGGVFRIQDEIPYLLEVMDKIYPQIETRLTIQDDLNEVYLDRDDMLELTGNLLDNACKFAKSLVQVKFRLIDEELWIIVEDDGPGVDAEQVLKITRKGTRLDETVDGHGLGLNICSDIIQSYHGRLDFSRSELSGLKVEVSIPLLLGANTDK